MKPVEPSRRSTEAAPLRAMTTNGSRRSPDWFWFSADPGLDVSKGRTKFGYRKSSRQRAAQLSQRGGQFYVGQIPNQESHYRPIFRERAARSPDCSCRSGRRDQELGVGWQPTSGGNVGWQKCHDVQSGHSIPRGESARALTVFSNHCHTDLEFAVVSWV